MPLVKLVFDAQTTRAREDMVRMYQDAATQARVFAAQVNDARVAALAQREAVDRLRDQMRNLSAELQRATTNSEARRRASINLSAAIEQERERYNQLNRQITVTMQARDTETRTTATSRAEYRRLSDELTRQRTELKGSADNLAALNLQKSLLNRTTVTQQREEARLRQELAAVNQQLAAAVAAQARVNRERVGASQTLREQEQRTKDLRDSANELTRELNDVARANRRQTESMTAAVTIGNLLADTIRNVASEVAGLVKETITYAGRTEELGVVLESISRVSGKSLASIKAQEAAIKSLGITTQNARELLAKFQVLDLPVEKASSLARVAQDLAVIAGIDTSEEIERLTNGITTLQVRALRTAGVFISIDKTLDDAAKSSRRARDSFSEQEKQQLVLNKVLEFGARATGTYEVAMETASKQMRSMNRLVGEAQNAFGGLFQGVFLKVIETLSLFLRLVNAAPGAIAGLAAAMAALGVIILLNTARGAALWLSLRAGGVSILQLAAQVTGLDFILTKFGVTMNATGLAAKGFSASLGLTIGFWLAIAAAVWAVYSAYSAYNDKQKELKFANTEDFKLATKRIEQNKEHAASLRLQLGEAKRLGNNYQQSKEAAQEFVEIQSKFDPVTRLNISNQVTYTDKINESIKALERLNELENQRLTALARSNVYAIRNAENQIKADESAITRLEAYNKAVIGGQIPKLRGAGGGASGGGSGAIAQLLSTISRPTTSPVATDEMLEQLTEQSADVAKRIAENREKVSNATVDIARALENFRKTYTGNDAIGDFFKNLNIQLSTDELKTWRNEMAQAEAQLRAMENVDPFETFREGVKRALSDISAPKIDVLGLGEGRKTFAEQVNTQLENTLRYTGNLSEAYRVNNDALKKLDDIIKDSSSTQEEYNQKVSSLPKLIQSGIYAIKQFGNASISTLGQAQAEMDKRIADVRGRLRNLSREVYELLEGNQGQAGALEIDERRLQMVRTELQQVIDLRLELGKPINVPIPENREERVRLVRQLNEEKKVRENIRSLIAEQEDFIYRIQEAQAAANISIVTAEEKASELIARNHRQRLEDERDLQAQLIAAVHERTRRESDSAGIVREAYLKVSLERLAQVNEVEEELAKLQASISLQSEVFGLKIASGVKTGLEDIKLPQRPEVELKTATNSNTDATRTNTEAVFKLTDAFNNHGRSNPDTKIRTLTDTEVTQTLDALRSVIDDRNSSGLSVASAYSLIDQLKAVQAKGSQPIAFENQSEFIQNLISDANSGQGLPSTYQKHDFYNYKTNSPSSLYSQNIRSLNKYKEHITSQISSEFGSAPEQETMERMFQTRMSELGQRGYEDYVRSNNLSTPVGSAATNQQNNKFAPPANVRQDDVKTLEDYSRKIKELAEAYNKQKRLISEGKGDPFVSAAEQYRAAKASFEDFAGTYYKLEQLESEYHQQYVNSSEYRDTLVRKSTISRIEAGQQVKDRLVQLEEEIANSSEGSAERIQVAYKEALLEISRADEKARASMLVNSAKIADAQIYHQDRVDARYLEWAASQKSVDDLVFESRTGVMESLFGLMDKGLDKMSQKLGIFGDVLKNIISGFAKLALSRLFLKMMGLDAQGTVSGNSTGGNQQSGGGFWNQFNLGGFLNPRSGSSGNGVSLPNIFGVGGTPSFAGSNPANNAVAAALTGLPSAITSPTGLSVPNWLDANGGVGTPTQTSRIGGMTNQAGGMLSSLFGKGAFGGIGFGAKAGTGGPFAGMRPLAGIGLGSALGGQSGLGSILGGIGGALLGVGLTAAPAFLLGGGAAVAGLSGGLAAGVGGAAAGGGLFGGLGGAMAGLFSNPITAIVGGGLLVTAVLLGRRAKRKAAEKQAAKLSGDAIQQLNQLLEQVRRDKVDGESAIAQALQIRQQYSDGVSQLQDKGTRKKAGTNISQLDAIINQIKAAAVAQGRRRELDAKLGPEFAEGGHVPNIRRGGFFPMAYVAYMAHLNKERLIKSTGNGMRVPGIDYGHDTVPAMLRPKELVLNEYQQRRIREIAGSDIFNVVGVPNTYNYPRNFYNGGYSTTPVTTTPQPTSSRNGGDIYIVTDERFANEMVGMAGGQVIRLVDQDIERRGPVYTRIRTTI